MAATALGRQMKVYRAQHDLTQYALGKKIGAGHAWVSRIENGEAQPTPKQAAKLAKLGIQTEAV
jgi:transcriptional regulator with XRE-family HTH domain